MGYPVPTLRLAICTAVLSFLFVLIPAGTFLPDAIAVGLFVINVPLAALAFLDFLLAGNPKNFVVERRIPDVVVMGSDASVTWRVTNAMASGRRLLLADSFAPSFHAGSRRSALNVPAAARISVGTRIRPSRRGRFTIDEIVVRVIGPMGLMGRQAKRRVPGVLRVYPAFRSRAEAELRIQSAQVLQVGLRSAQGRGGGTEFDSLREYTVDDEFRRIDWAATARSEKAVVRTYRAERNQTVITMLDSGRLMAGSAEGASRLEHAMDAVMMVTSVATRLGDRAGLVCFADTIRATVPPRSRRDQLATVTDAMYSIQPVLAESDYRGAFADTLSQFRRRALLILLTDLIGEAVAETLLPALPLALRNHLVVIGAIADPQVEKWARMVPIDATAAYRKAAAISSLQERERTAAKLRSVGARVIDAPPSAMAARLTDAYLFAKAAGRL